MYTTLMLRAHELDGSSVNSRNISVPVKNYMWATSGNQCAYPDCHVHVMKNGNEQDGPVTIGQFAHIFAHSQHGPRPNPDGFSEKTNEYENLILLCANHHQLVDGQPNTYSVRVLKEWKIDHEAWFLNLSVTNDFNTGNLDSIRWPAEYTTLSPSTDFILKPVREKIAFNGLSEIVKDHILKGLSRVGEAKRHIREQSRLTPDYAERLLTPLVYRYNELKEDGYNGDLIFATLVRFACGNSNDASKRAAALSLIVYFFERCEIFEK